MLSVPRELSSLKTKTWAELGKWFHLLLAKDLFRLSATAIFAADDMHERTWRIDMVPWSENNVVAFQGLHNEGKRLLMIYDEASGIPDGIWEAGDGCMTDKSTQRIWCVFGKPPHCSIGSVSVCGNYIGMGLNRCESVIEPERATRGNNRHGQEKSHPIRVTG